MVHGPSADDNQFIFPMVVFPLADLLEEGRQMMKVLILVMDLHYPYLVALLMLYGVDHIVFDQTAQ